MENAVQKVLVFLAAATLGYCAGFSDAQRNEQMVFTRVVERVQNFAERTVGDRQRQSEKVVDDVEP